ncbi:MAG: hypothetical protein ABI947_24075 [Chloroflexota bacterium]
MLLARLIKLTPIVFPIMGDVVEAIVRSMDDVSTCGKKYMLGGPEVLTYEEIVKRVLKALGTSRLLLAFRLRRPSLPSVPLKDIRLPRWARTNHH